MPGIAPPTDGPTRQCLEDTTGWPIKKFVRTTRRYRTIQIQPAHIPSPQPPPYPPTCATHWTASTATPMRTNVSRVTGQMFVARSRVPATQTPRKEELAAAGGPMGDTPMY